MANRAKLSWLVALSLALGILPSFTALSSGLASAIPGWARYIGPINLLKISSPLLALYLWRQRAELPVRFKRLLWALLIVGSISTFIGAVQCHFPPTLLREWAVMIIGALGALCFWLLPEKQKNGVLAFWLTAVIGTAILDLLAPTAVDWLYIHVFDPETRKFDALATGHRLLTGVFGNQSMAKLLSWFPWVLLAFTGWFSRGRRWWLWLGIAIVSTALILKTSQRGPFLGAVCAWLVFALHRYVRHRDRFTAAVAGIAVCLSVMITVVIVPRDMLEARIRSALGEDSAQIHSIRAAFENVYFRKRMFWLTLDLIAQEPMGDACVPDHVFFDAGVYPSHTHNLFLQQYRDRGWVWGSLHLLAWLAAWIGAWRSSGARGSPLVAGITAVAVQGMFDQPWFVLNHAVILGLMLTGGVLLLLQDSKMNLTHLKNDENFRLP